MRANIQRVYWSVTPEQGNSPYIAGIANGLRAEGWEVRKLSLFSLAYSRNQTIHVQWPEHVSRGGGVVRTSAKQVRAVALLALVALAKHKIVITAHNRAPHGKSGAFDRWFRRKLYHRAEALVVLVSGHAQELSEAAVITSKTIIKTIPHPLTHLGVGKGERREDGALVILGQIHPYHLIEEFLDALEAANNKRQVIIVGKVGDPDLLQRLSHRDQSTTWITLTPGFISDKELESLLTGAAAVVSLQKNTFNSGGPYVALPLGLPVVLSQGAQAEQLTSELGGAWVYSLPEDIQVANLAGLEEWVVGNRQPLDLSKYGMESIVAEHAALYELVNS